MQKTTLVSAFYRALSLTDCEIVFIWITAWVSPLATLLHGLVLKENVSVWLITRGIFVRQQISRVRMTESAQGDVNLCVSMGSLAAIDKVCRR